MEKMITEMTKLVECAKTLQLDNVSYELKDGILTIKHSIYHDRYKFDRKEGLDPYSNEILGMYRWNREFEQFKMME